VKNIKQYFLTGILILAPLGVTVWLLLIVAKFIVHTFHVSILPRGLPDYIPLSDWLRAALVAVFEFGNFLIGLLLALVLIMAVGALVRTYVGKRLISFGESLIDRIPFIRSVYNAVKQLTETVFRVDETKNFNRVVLIEYPRKGIRSIGFVTSRTRGQISRKLRNNNLLNIFIPSTPNPTTGYYLVIPEEDVIEMDLTPEEAFRIIISGGLAADGEDFVEEASEEDE